MPRRSQDLPSEYVDHLRAVAVAIGQRLRQRRTRLGLTQENLRARMEADFVYVTRARFSRMEIGELLPNAAEVVALCSALDVSLSWLLLGREDASGQDR